MVMAPGGNLGGSSGSVAPANLPAYPPSTLTGPIVLQGTSQIQAGNYQFLPNFNNLFGGVGAPGAGLGSNGDYYFRADTPGTANQRIYVKSAGAWVGIV